LHRSEKNPIKGKVKQQLQIAVTKLSEQPQGSWTRDLSQILTADEIVKILNLPHEIVNRPVIVLKQVPKEWGFIAEIRG
jgi:arsenate reductase-like glutaredoxin family protein